jgi:hypothetical protein
MARRIHYLLHRGCVQIRNLSQNAVNDHRRQIEDLADVLEIVPKYLESWDDGSLDDLKQLFTKYEAKYPSETYPFTPFLDEYPIHRWY